MYSPEQYRGRMITHNVTALGRVVENAKRSRIDQMRSRTKVMYKLRIRQIAYFHFLQMSVYVT